MLANNINILNQQQRNNTLQYDGTLKQNQNNTVKKQVKTSYAEQLSTYNENLPVLPQIQQEQIGITTQLSRNVKNHTQVFQKVIKGENLNEKENIYLQDLIPRQRSPFSIIDTNKKFRDREILSSFSRTKETLQIPTQTLELKRNYQCDKNDQKQIFQTKTNRKSSLDQHFVNYQIINYKEKKQMTTSSHTKQHILLQPNDLSKERAKTSHGKFSSETATANFQNSFLNIRPLLTNQSTENTSNVKTEDVKLFKINEFNHSQTKNYSLGQLKNSVPLGIITQMNVGFDQHQQSDIQNGNKQQQKQKKGAKSTSSTPLTQHDQQQSQSKLSNEVMKVTQKDLIHHHKQKVQRKESKQNKQIISIGNYVQETINHQIQIDQQNISLNKLKQNSQSIYDEQKTINIQSNTDYQNVFNNLQQVIQPQNSSSMISKETPFCNQFSQCFIGQDQQYSISYTPQIDKQNNVKVEYVFNNEEIQNRIQIKNKQKSQTEKYIRYSDDSDEELQGNKRKLIQKSVKINNINQYKNIIKSQEDIKSTENKFENLEDPFDQNENNIEQYQFSIEKHQKEIENFDNHVNRQDDEHDKKLELLENEKQIIENQVQKNKNKFRLKQNKKRSISAQYYCHSLVDDNISNQEGEINIIQNLSFLENEKLNQDMMETNQDGIFKKKILDEQTLDQPNIKNNNIDKEDRFTNKSKQSNIINVNLIENKTLQAQGRSNSTQPYVLKGKKFTLKQIFQKNQKLKKQTPIHIQNNESNLVQQQSMLNSSHQQGFNQQNDLKKQNTIIKNDLQKFNLLSVQKINLTTANSQLKTGDSCSSGRGIGKYGIQTSIAKTNSDDENDLSNFARNAYNIHTLEMMKTNASIQLTEGFTKTLNREDTQSNTALQKQQQKIKKDNSMIFNQKEYQNLEKNDERLNLIMVENQIYNHLINQEYHLNKIGLNNDDTINMKQQNSCSEKGENQSRLENNKIHQNNQIHQYIQSKLQTNINSNTDNSKSNHDLQQKYHMRRRRSTISSVSKRKQQQEVMDTTFGGEIPLIQRTQFQNNISTQSQSLDKNHKQQEDFVNETLFYKKNQRKTVLSSLNYNDLKQVKDQNFIDLAKEENQINPLEESFQRSIDHTYMNQVLPSKQFERKQTIIKKQPEIIQTQKQNKQYKQSPIQLAQKKAISVNLYHIASRDNDKYCFHKFSAQFDNKKYQPVTIQQLPLQTFTNFNQPVYSLTNQKASYNLNASEIKHFNANPPSLIFKNEL